MAVVAVVAAAARWRRAGRVRAVEAASWTGSCSSPWSGTGTPGASSAPAATPSWASTAAPATAKEGWCSAGTTTSGEPQRVVDQSRSKGMGSSRSRTHMFRLNPGKQKQHVTQ